jgi:predicted acetyltransferase
MTADLEVISASREQAPILANLLELYAHDFSEFHDVQIGDDGRFGYAALPLYWSAPDRYPLLFKIDGKLAGLALVEKREECWDMAEFFVLRGCRRRGIGTRVAHEVWRQFPGVWQIRVMQANVSAMDFWARAIESFVGKAILPVHFEKGAVSWTIFSFNCGS